MRRTRFALLAAAAAAVVAGSAWSQVAASTGSFADRTIRITERTRHVNVMRYETVRFLIADAQGGEKSFEWRVEYDTRQVFPLADVAPAGALGNRAILVYVQREPRGD